MRVWAFPSIYPYDYEGMSWFGIFAHRQYKQLIEIGADLTVIIPILWYPPFPFSQLHPDWKYLAKYHYPKKRVYDGITVYHPRIYNMRPNRFVKKTYSERCIDSITNFFKDNKIELDPAKDIFFSQWLPDAAFVQQAAHRLGVKSAILGIGDDILVYPYAKEDNFNTFKKTLLEADLRLTNADYLGKEANKIIGMNLPFETIYFEVNCDFFKPASPENIELIKKEYNIPVGKVIILTVGSSIIRKGWLDLFDALKEVKKVNENFLLVGVHAGSPEFDFTKEIDTRGLTSNFLNIGEIKPASLNRLYNAADIFCLPSHWEGLATVVIEAMASGLPVITTNVCGHPEIINSGVSGVLVPSKQPEILTKELLNLINDEEKRKQMGENARNFIVSKFGPGNTQRLYKLLENTLSK